MIERFITCYPRIDAVRGRFREEVARLGQLQKGELDRLYNELTAKRGSAVPMEVADFEVYQKRKIDLVTKPAADNIFLPVVLACGFRTLDEYGAALQAVIHHFPSQPEWLKPYLGRVDSMRVPNLN